MPTDNQEVRAPRVAVILPCFNHAEYVEEAIKSVIAQDYEYKAIFISDEGSTDNSVEVISSLMDVTPDLSEEGLLLGHINGVITVLYKNADPRGPSAARNKLIKMAWDDFDFFSMLDADDAYFAGKLSKSIKQMMEDPGMIGLVYSDAVIQHDKTGVKVREYREPFSRNRIEQECIVSNTPLINKRALAECGLYDESMRTAEDWDLWLRITERFVAVHIPEALHMYRVTGRNSSNVVPQEVWQQNWQKIRDRLNGQRN